MKVLWAMATDYTVRILCGHVRMFTGFLIKDMGNISWLVPTVVSCTKGHFFKASEQLTRRESPKTGSPPLKKYSVTSLVE